MEQEIVTARFLGKSSLGYIPEKVYSLCLWIQLYKGKECLWIRRLDGNGKCPYTSYDKFEENWDVLSKRLQTTRTQIQNV